MTFSFTYSCPDPAFCLGGGSPRWSIPIDTGGKPGWDIFAFVDAANCGQGPTGGTVDTSCPVSDYNGGPYANWAAYAAAHPTYKIAQQQLTFIIADQPFEGTISNVSLARK